MTTVRNWPSGPGAPRRRPCGRRRRARSLGSESGPDRRLHPGPQFGIFALTTFGAVVMRKRHERNRTAKKRAEGMPIGGRCDVDFTKVIRPVGKVGAHRVVVCAIDGEQAFLVALGKWHAISPAHHVAGPFAEV